ncbi:MULTISPECIES: dimethylsulfonioproprionate lyase family protein [unclassified Pseudomonas]|uniref:dimethylsulfonioproprionate lyase family protein n=1 Tax=Pseudomonas sp. A-R-26 TaxID=2832404 RepID=UPI001CC1A248|nr:dimethylsulfonioproprionate lyase family protein [Pseudomonas sp. A-R-26]
MDVSLNSQSGLPCSTLTVGLAVMEPDLCYPYHKHPPAEFNVVLSEGYWYRKDVGCMTLSYLVKPDTEPSASEAIINHPSSTH